MNIIVYIARDSRLHIYAFRTFDGVGTLTEIEGNMNTTKYLETLGDNIWPVIP
jgi:hypothetical protein